MRSRIFLMFAMAVCVISMLTGVAVPASYGQAATGGVVTNVGSVWVHTFTSSGTFSITNAGGIANVEILVVGGGGAGGGGNGNPGGGGGGGGDFVTNTYAFLGEQEIGVTVGAGGNGVSANVGGRGGDSYFAIAVPATTITALGGGGGGARIGSGTSAPTTGGSGGGGTFSSTATRIGADGTGVNVNKGGDGNSNIGSMGGAGGGGAFSAGTSASSHAGTNGGEGMGWYGVTYASGGGGGGSAGNSAAGGSGGTNAADGADGRDGVAKNGPAAPDNYGGGGGGSAGKSGFNVSGGKGGKGLVIVRYEIPAVDIIVTQNDLPVLEGSTNSLTDPSIFTGETTNRTYVVLNASTDTIDFTGSPAVSFSGSGTPFSITANIEGDSKTLAPGESAQFTISFSSQAPGIFEKTVVIPYSVASRSESFTFNVTATAAVWAKIQGGDIIKEYTDDQRVAWIAHVFTNTGPHTITVVSAGMVECLVVAGGGAGGRVRGGGGGAGGYLEDFTFLPIGSNTVVVGAGGFDASGDGNGQNSTVGTLEAIGGGRGARYRGYTTDAMGYDGGSGGGGGGGGADYAPAGKGTTGQGRDGGVGTSSNTSGGGGGGAGATGYGQGTTGTGSFGGAGLPGRFVDGEEYWYAGGGAGMRDTGSSASGGQGGGGAGNVGTTGSNATSGMANTGGGGGGGGTTGGDGGSGIVVVRYPKPPSGTVLIIK